MKFTVLALLDGNDNVLTENEIAEKVTEREWELVQIMKLGDAFQYRDKQRIDIYRTILEVALEDDELSPDELRLLTKLRSHLGLHERDHYILQAELGKFPKPNNESHTRSEIAETLTELQRRGVVFHCNQAPDNPFYVIPEEIVPGVKQALGVELNERAYKLLLTNLSTQQQQTVCQAFYAPVYGSKAERANRIYDLGVQPSKALDSISNEELYEICKGLPGVKVSGSKNEKIGNIIEHFDRLKTVTFEENVDERQRYYEYYEQLAQRDLQNLLPNKIVTKSESIGRVFEEATRFLFETKLNLVLEPMAGSEHPDGIIKLPNEVLFLWDTKSDESEYQFPNTHFNQFKRYIRDSSSRATCFLIIAPKISQKAEANAIRLKAESNTDTDIALIGAEELKQISEDWVKNSAGKPFNLQIFNYTGILSWPILQDRIKIFTK